MGLSALMYTKPKDPNKKPQVIDVWGIKKKKEINEENKKAKKE